MICGNITFQVNFGVLNPKTNVAELKFVSMGSKIKSRHNFPCDAWPHDCYYGFEDAEFKNECCQAEFYDLGV